MGWSSEISAGYAGKLGSIPHALASYTNDSTTISKNIRSFTMKMGTGSGKFYNGSYCIGYGNAITFQVSACVKDSSGSDKLVISESGTYSVTTVAKSTSISVSNIVTPNDSGSATKSEMVTATVTFADDVVVSPGETIYISWISNPNQSWSSRKQQPSTWIAARTAELLNETGMTEAEAKALATTESLQVDDLFAKGQVFTLNKSTMTGTVEDYSSQCTISYNANGGSGAPSAQTAIVGEATTLSTTTPTRTGHSFLGWSTSSTATSASYSAGGTITPSGDTTLYAVWKLKTYTVSYNANGGSGAPSSQTKTHGVNLTLSSTEPTWAGRLFKGWATTSTATSIQYAAGGTYSNDADVTLYAVWESETYTITYNANGHGTNVPSNQTKTYGQNLTLSEVTPTGNTYSLSFNKGTSAPSVVIEEEYTDDEGTVTKGTVTYPEDTMPDAVSGQCVFSSWNTRSDGSGTTYTPGASFNVNANTTLYAIWTFPSVTIPPGVPERRDGATFIGWSLQNGSSTATYFPGGVLSINYNVTLYAVWKVPSYTVTFNLNGGTYSGSVPLTQTVKYGEDAILPYPEPTKDGKKFQGWLGEYTNVTFDSVVYAMWDTHPIWVMTAEGWRRLST